MRNLLTIDVEDYFQVHAFSGAVGYEDWAGFESRVERNSSVVMRLMEEAGARATFFVLGWVAERFPDMVRTMVERGHEVASHGYAHRHIGLQTRDEFRRDVRRSKEILEGITGRPVLGYRAPTYSVTRKSLWALGILREEGYRYDSSIFPIHHDNYGIPAAPRHPFRFCPPEGDAVELADLAPEPVASQEYGRIVLRPGQMLEIPISTVRMLGSNLPIAGGGYFRLVPYRLLRLGLRRVNLEGVPFIFYLHPWEFDPGQPRVRGAPLRSRFRHYLNLQKTSSRFRQLLTDFSFAPVASLFAAER